MYEQQTHYQVEGYCTNCDYVGPITIRKGERVPIRQGFFDLAFSSRLPGLPVMCPKCGNASCYANRSAVNE